MISGSPSPVSPFWKCVLTYPSANKRKCSTSPREDENCGIWGEEGTCIGNKVNEHSKGNISHVSRVTNGGSKKQSYEGLFGGGGGML